MGKSKYRDYSAEDKASALTWLDAHDGDIKQAAEELGIPKSTLYRWDTETPEYVEELKKEKKKTLSDRFEEVAHAYLERALNAGAIEDTKGKDAVIAAATATSNHLLLLGQPTTINKDVSERTNEERADRILKLVRPSEVA